MFEKIIRGLILAGLVIFYLSSIYHNFGNLYDAVVLNRINFIVLVAILYFAADYMPSCMNICILVLVCGLLFHGYTYYSTRVSESNPQQQTEQTKQNKCTGEGSNWYSKLSNRCY